MIVEVFAIALGGGLGAVIRGALVRLAGPEDRLGWPPAGPAFATLLANTLGCALYGAWIRHGPQALEGSGIEIGSVALFEGVVLAGLLGGLSTFSSLCADTLRLARTRGPWAPGLYLAATIALGHAALSIGAGFRLF